MLTPLMDQTFSLEVPRPCPEPVVIHMDRSATLPEHLFPLLDPEPHEALLLSGGTHPLSRYSYIGLEPFLVLTSHGNKVCLDQPSGSRIREVTADPFQILQDLLRLYGQEPQSGLPSFWSGGIGYLSYELGRHLERLPCTVEDDLGIPELYFVFYRSVLTYSHRDQRYTLFALDFPGEKISENERTRKRLRERVRKGLDGSFKQDNFKPSTLPLNLESNFSRSGYIDAIRRVLHYIREGDIYQANLSQRFQTPYNGDPYGLFLKLFEINPAPFFAFLNPGPFQVISSSPERFLYLHGKEVETRPIKGTLPRGNTPEEDLANREGLLTSGKNRAELAMITDLLRNDLGRVSEYGSVELQEAVQLETYTNVFHLLSIIRGRLKRDKDVVDLLRGTFPGGSITGCPKIRSMEIIDELEPTVRSVYTGSIGYLGWDGTMDLNIAIRTLLLQNNRLYYQVGGGIVSDSVPEEEYEETLHKASSMKEALISTCVL